MRRENWDLMEYSFIHVFCYEKPIKFSRKIFYGCYKKWNVFLNATVFTVSSFTQNRLFARVTTVFANFINRILVVLIISWNCKEPERPKFFKSALLEVIEPLAQVSQTRCFVCHHHHGKLHLDITLVLVVTFYSSVGLNCKKNTKVFQVDCHLLPAKIFWPSTVHRIDTVKSWGIDNVLS